jgi:hypothetical protein
LVRRVDADRELPIRLVLGDVHAQQNTPPRF